MAIQKKTQFDNYKVHKVTSGSLLREKPIFSKDGQHLVVGSNESCHLYNTTTGEHLAEILTCESPIVSLQPDPADESCFLATTKDGKIYRRDFAIDGETSLYCQLQLNKETLKKLNFVWFFETKKKPDKIGESYFEFFYSIVYNGNIYASFCKSFEKKAHVGGFDLKGNLLSENYFINVGILKKPENFAIGKDFIVLQAEKFVHVTQLSVNHYRKHYIDMDKLSYTKIVAHPNEVLFATGDTQGRILVWRNIFEQKPLKDIYHWHTLPVRTLIFTESGSHIFSGGDENVLVKWSLATRTKNFLPRLSSNICHISIAKNNTLLSVTTTDSRILIINMNLNCLATVQHFSRWTTVGQSKGRILTQDPRTEALVLSGRTGHVQFLSTGPDRGRFLYTLDVTLSNFITRERKMEIENIEVKFTKFTRCGKWLITAEEGGEEARLKFWFFDTKKQEFSLNTDVDAPHGCSGIEYLEVGSIELVATGGSDGSFRLWGTFETSHLQKTVINWGQIGSGSHHQLPTCADFSRDATLLAVGFGPALTLWDTEKCDLKCTLVPPLERNKLKFIRFGNNNVSHLIVTGTENELNCWNVVTLCRQWVVLVNLSLLVSDPYSHFMCAFSNKNLFVFDPSSPQPELQMENVCDKSVTAALFVARTDAPNLYFLTEDQSLYCLGDQIQQESAVTLFSKITPFNRQLALNIRRDVIPGKSLDRVNSSNNFIETILDGPAHAMPPVGLLMDDYLSSLLQTVQLSGPTLKPVEEEDIVVVEAADRFKVRKELTEHDLEKCKDILVKIVDKSL